MDQKLNTLPRLELPKRWELLEQRAKQAGLDAKEFVTRVDSAASRLDRLLRKVRTGGGGLIEVVYGLSGSGKTTFLNTLPKFFDKIRVHSFQQNRDLKTLPSFLKETFVPNDDHARIIIVERRDHPKDQELTQVEEMLSDLLNGFRDPTAESACSLAYNETGRSRVHRQPRLGGRRDSMVAPDTKGFFEFHGVPREKYYELSDLTTRNLTGDGLDAFGLDFSHAQTLQPECETIADFYSAVNEYTERVREDTWSVLKEKVRTRLWVLLPGDDNTALSTTVSALTQGGKNRIDVEKIAEFLDRPENHALYITEWVKRRASLAHHLRTIDVRLFEVPPTVALAAMRSFGDEVVKKRLKQRATNLEQSKKTMRSSRFYKAILSTIEIPTTPFAGFREVKPETRMEYHRVQALAANRNDKPLNKALGALIAACLRDDAPNLTVSSEKRNLPKSQLQPDIQIQIAGAEFICLEPTWRSSGRQVEGEKRQSTLAEAYLLKYVLDKAAQYIKDLDL